MSIMHCSLLSLGCAFGFTPPDHAASLSALRALKIAQRRLRPEVRSKLLSVTSARSDNTLSPAAWRFVFLDPATSGNCRIVTVAAKTSSEHPDTVEAFSSARHERNSTCYPIMQGKLLIDSDKALDQARITSKLKGAKSADYRLMQQKASTEPLWTLQFYADDDVPLACYQVGAKSAVIELCDPSGKI